MTAVVPESVDTGGDFDELARRVDEAVTALAEAIRTLTGPQAPDRRLVRDAAVTRCGIEAMLDAHEDLYEETTS